MEDHKLKKKWWMRQADVPIELIAIKIINDSENELVRPQPVVHEKGISNQDQVERLAENSKPVPKDSLTNNQRIVEVSRDETNSMMPNTINDPKTDLLPIIGYAKEHLLPLFKACTPLDGIIHNPGG